MKISLNEPSRLPPYSTLRHGGVLNLPATRQLLRRVAQPSTHALALLMLVLTLSACSSGPPRPPQPDDANRRPANDPQAIELQQCRSDLQNNAIQLRESALASQRAVATASRLAALRTLENSLRAKTTDDGEADGKAAKAARNPMYTIRFPLGSAVVPLSRSQLEALAQAANDAPLIVLRGRTDGARDSLADDRLARERAEAVRSLLVQEGIAAARIRTTWQGSGDHAADNGSPAGRDLNRRVEVEIYRVAPIDLVLPAAVSDATDPDAGGALVAAQTP
jgi:outer membrane protein OmpA-like peptidoglycan-associated protein